MHLQIELFSIGSTNTSMINWQLDVFDAHRSERPRTAVTEEMIDALRLSIEDDPRAVYQ